MTWYLTHDHKVAVRYNDLYLGGSLKIVFLPVDLIQYETTSGVGQTLCCSSHKGVTMCRRSVCLDLIHSVKGLG